MGSMILRDVKTTLCELRTFITETHGKMLNRGVHPKYTFGDSTHGLAGTFAAEPDEEYDGEHMHAAELEGHTFGEIAKELGFSVAGAKFAVDTAMEKTKYLLQMDPDDAELLVLTSMDEYIKHLEKVGDLDKEDVRLMRDNPNIVRELDGFRDHLAQTVKHELQKHRKTQSRDRKMEPWEQSLVNHRKKS